MFLEPQTCPQCGAAIAFSGSQLQTTCTHCGTLVHKKLAQSAPRYARFSELPPDIVRQIRELVWGGNRHEAAAIVQSNLGVAPSTAQAEIERLVAYTLVPEFDSQAPLTRLEVTILTVIPLLTGAFALFTVIPAIAIVLTQNSLGQALVVCFTGSGMGVLFGGAIFGILVVAAQRSVWQSLRLLRGRSAPATIQALVLLTKANLKPIDAKEEYGYYRLELQLKVPEQAERIINRIVFMPLATAQQLKVHQQIEVKYQGRDYVYPSVPIKRL